MDVEEDENLRREREEKNKEKQKQAKAKLGEHTSYADFPETEPLTEPELQDFATRILVLKGSSASKQVKKDIKKILNVWGATGIDLFLADRPFREIYVDKELASWDNMTRV